MGNTWVREFREGPEIIPRQDSVPTFDPMLGFPNGRKPRVMTVTAEVSTVDTVNLIKPSPNKTLKEHHLLFFLFI